VHTCFSVLLNITFYTSATGATVTRLAGEHLQAGTEPTPVLDRLAPLRCLHDFCSAHTYPDFT